MLILDNVIKNCGMDEAQAGIKIAGRNINNLRYADDTTFMAESEEELKSLLMKVKEESEKLAQNSSFRKLTSWHPVPLFMANRWGDSETVADFKAPKSLQVVIAAMKSKDAYSLEEKL